MKSANRIPVALLVVALLCGCVATAPVKVVKKSAKVGVATAKTSVKATKKAVDVAIPDGNREQDGNDSRSESDAR